MDLSKYTGVEVNPCRREILDGQDIYEVCQPEDAELVAAGLSMLLTNHTKG